MTSAPRRRMLAALALPATLLALGAGATSAQAAGPALDCKGSPLSAKLLGLDLNLGLIGANLQGSSCTTQAFSGTAGLPLGITAGALAATTTLDNPGGTVPAQVGHATASLLNLGVAPTGFAGLLSVATANSTAQVSCLAGGPVYSGSSDLTGLKIGGQDVNLGSTIQTINGNGLNGLTVGMVATIIPNEVTTTATSYTRSAAHVMISAASNVSILDISLAPSTVGIQGTACDTTPVPTPTVTVTTTTPTPTVTVPAPTPTVVVQAPVVTVPVTSTTKLLSADTPVDDVATVTTTTTVPTATTSTVVVPGPTASIFDTGNESSLLLACSAAKLVLTDVQLRGDEVALRGAAIKSSIGKTVSITYVPTGKVVARTKVGLDGLFAVRAAAPSKAERTSNGARYRATLGTDRTRDFKLVRRTAITKVTKAATGGLNVSGVVRRPLARAAQTVQVQRRTSCTSYKTVGSAKLRADGSFKVSVPLPAGAAAALLRVGTKVPAKAGSAKVHPTYSLVRSVRVK